MTIQKFARPNDLQGSCNGHHAIWTHVFVRLLDTKSCIEITRSGTH